MDNRKTFPEKALLALNNQPELSKQAIPTQDVLMNKIIPQLDDYSYVNLAKTCKFFLFSLHENYKQKASFYQKIWENLRDHCLNRDPFLAGEIILQHPYLLTHEDEIEDGFLDSEMEKRKFSGLSVINYAAWSLDTPMLYWLVLYWAFTFVPENNLHKKEAFLWIDALKNSRGNYPLIELKDFLDKMLIHVPKQNRHALVTHLNKLAEIGTAYGTHYDINSLTDPLLKIYKNRYRWASQRHEAAWGMVRAAQHQITLPIANEYCRDRKIFSEKTSFTTDHLNRRDAFSVDYHLLPKGWRDLVKDNEFPTQGAVIKFNKEKGARLKVPETQDGWEDVYRNVQALKNCASQSQLELKALKYQLAHPVLAKNNHAAQTWFNDRNEQLKVVGQHAKDLALAGGAIISYAGWRIKHLK